MVMTRYIRGSIVIHVVTHYVTVAGIIKAAAQLLFTSADPGLFFPVMSFLEALK
jgi:hypothetical protein